MCWCILRLIGKDSSEEEASSRKLVMRDGQSITMVHPRIFILIMMLFCKEIELEGSTTVSHFSFELALLSFHSG